MLAEKAILDSHPTFTYHTFSAEFVSAVYLLMATIGRQQQQQKGKGSGDTRCPDKAASIRVFPPKKSVISPMNFSKVMEWYLQRHTHWERNSNVQHQRTVDGITVSYYSILVNNCGRWGLVLKCTKQQEKKSDMAPYSLSSVIQVPRLLKSGMDLKICDLHHLKPKSLK